MPPKLRAQLQQEIASTCPVCASREVACFEVHHLNGDRSNNAWHNLLMLYPTCHAKVEKGLISPSEIMAIKRRLPQTATAVELAAITLDPTVCTWVTRPENEHAFNNVVSDRYQHLVLDFSFINHTSQTVVLKSVEIAAKNLYSGLSGFGPDPHPLYPVAHYHVQLRWDGRPHTMSLLPPVAVSAEQAFMVRMTITQGNTPNENFPIESRKALYLRFFFSGGVEVKAPVLCLNCLDENEPLPLIESA